MSAHYDKFDYPSYWIGREYEHKAEMTAISAFLKKIKYIENILEIGAGYGRLVPSYIHRARNITITDPSSKLLSLARKNMHFKSVKMIHSSWENLNNKFKKGKFDLIISIRVLHHVKNIKQAFNIVYNLLKYKGYFILEFPNKNHLKSLLKEIFRGNLIVLYDILPKDLRSISNIRKKSISFNNYHPGYILEQLKNSGFEIIEIRSVSNIRNKFLKKHMPLHMLNTLEKLTQKLFAFIYLGPSTFILARKNK